MRGAPAISLVICDCKPAFASQQLLRSLRSPRPPSAPWRVCCPAGRAGRAGRVPCAGSAAGPRRERRSRARERGCGRPGLRAGGLSSCQARLQHPGARVSAFPLCYTTLWKDSTVQTNLPAYRKHDNVPRTDLLLQPEMTERGDKLLEELTGESCSSIFLRRRNHCKMTKHKGQHHFKFIEKKDLGQRVPLNFQHCMKLLSLVFMNMTLRFAGLYSCLAERPCELSSTLRHPELADFLIVNG